MNWDWLDFLVAGALFTAVGGIWALAVRSSGSTAYRAGVAIALGAALVLFWVNAAVGIIGDENDDANMLYHGVLAVGIAGALLSRFRSSGMSRAMIAAAIAQLLVPAIALTMGLAASGPAWPWDVVVLTVFFCGLWLLSAWSFRAAGVQRSSEAES